MLNQVMVLPLLSAVMLVMTGLLIRTERSSITMVPVTAPEPPEANLTESCAVLGGTTKRPETRSKGEAATLPSQPGLWPPISKLYSGPEVTPPASRNPKDNRIFPFVVE